MAREVRHYCHSQPLLVLFSVCLLIFVPNSAGAGCAINDLADFPKAYDAYSQQCGYQNTCCNLNSCPSLECFSELEKKALETAVEELRNNEANSMDPRLLIGAQEFDLGFFQTAPIKPHEEVGVVRTLTTEKFLQALVEKYGVCPVKSLLEGKCYSNLTLACCQGGEQVTCDPHYPYRSYDGSCNNLQNPTWGKRGNPLKHPFAPCYSDLVSQPALSKSGNPLPQNRKLMSGVSEFLEKFGIKATSNLNMFLVFFSEFINSDMIGRANKRTRKGTQGFRGCLVDRSDRNPPVSRLTNPLRVLPEDRYYGPLGVHCLNFSPQEKANDRCELKHVAERNLESSYLDLSSLYTDEPQYDSYGKLKLFQCGATEAVVTSEPITAQAIAIAGLFGNLHNYCVDRVNLCPQCKGSPQERCRALTIGVYQKLIYGQLLHFLFGEELYNRCGLDCEYNPYVESAVSQVYKSGPGRFQHVWIPDQMLYVSNGKSEWLPFNVFFHDQQQFDCTGTLDGVLKSPITIGKLTSAMVDKFYTVDGVRGTCLPCIDLARNRGAGLCPLVTYKHFFDQLFGDETGCPKCYSSFEDLKDMFSPQFADFLKLQYESPSDVDALMSIFDRRRYPDAKLPKLVSQATCLEFKRLKCTDRFFYNWNPHLGTGARHLINAFDFTTLLALFTEMKDVPLMPFVTDSPRVIASDVRGYAKTLDYLFCHL